MHPNAPKGRVIIEWKEADTWSEAPGGILLPSDTFRRNILRSIERKEFTADAPPPDIYRWGTLVAGECDAPSGSEVYFNRHDAERLDREGKTYYSLPETFLLMWRLSTPSVDSESEA